jgi:hypothetical protein
MNKRNEAGKKKIPAKKAQVSFTMVINWQENQ